MQINLLGVVGAMHFFRICKHLTFAACIHPLAGHVVNAENHVLRGNDDRLTTGRREDVVGRHHQRAAFKLSFQRERYVHCHLVAVEIRVVRSTDERVQLDGLTFDEHRLKRLDTQTVKCWGAVQENRVFANDLCQDIPDFGCFAFYHLLRSLDGRRQLTIFELAEDKRLEEFQCHLLGQTTLMQFERRTNHDHRSTGVIYALTKQVLTETSLLTLDHVRKRFQRALVRAGDGSAATTVIQKRVHRFLQHALFVTYDDIRRRQIQQSLQTVVTVDHTTVQVIQI